MSALPSDPAEAGTSVPSQDETHQRLHELLSAVTAAGLEALLADVGADASSEVPVAGSGGRE